MSGTYRSGRRPVPSAVHRLRGTAIRHRHAEPQLPVGRPAVPPAIEADPVAFAHWEALATRLEAMRILNAGHGPALALLAQTLADHDRVRAQLHALHYPEVVVDETWDTHGTLLRRRTHEHPLIRRSERLTLLVTRLLGDFGLTPVTQTKVHAEADTPYTRAQRYL
jgi:hypothetical protein